MPISPMSPLGAMMQGISDGDQQAQSILPNVYQPQGKAQAKNPFQGSIDLIVKQVLDIAHELKNQGDQFRDCTEHLYKVSYDLAKINNQITAKAEGDQESGGY